MTLSNPPVARLQLGQLLRELRENAKKTQEDAAVVLECRTPKVSKIETGKATIGPGDVRLLIDLYNTNGDTADTALQLAREARKRTHVRVPDWARRFVALESMAESIHVYEPELIPGLLQTEDYMRAVTEAADPGQDHDEIERLVAVHTERRTRLADDAPLELRAVINEAAVRRPVGGPRVIRDQLEHLRQLGELPRITVQLLPFSAGAHVAMGASFHILRTPPPTAGQVVYIEDLATAEYLESSTRTERYIQAFDRLREAALDESRTRTMLGQIIHETS